jgi:hypothetical protein
MIPDNPILLKVDYEGGHGGGTDLMHAYGIVGEVFGFLAWQLGLPVTSPKIEIINFQMISFSNTKFFLVLYIHFAVL